MSLLKKAVEAFRNETFFMEGGYKARAVPSEGDTLKFELKIEDHTSMTILWHVDPVTGEMSILQYPEVVSSPRAEVVDLLNTFYRSKSMFRLAQIGEDEYRVEMTFGGQVQILDFSQPIRTDELFKVGHAA